MPIRELRVVLTVSDLNQALQFFRDGLGLDQIAEFHNDGGHGFLLEAGRATLELFDGAQAEAIDQIEVGRRAGGPVRLAVETDNSDSLAKKLAAAGAEVIGGPVVTPWGDLNARVVGPDSIQLTLFTPAKA
jgi:catechol 2,3-dioxygenase-like lactoylglutathione lyase family enzyme